MVHVLVHSHANVILDGRVPIALSLIVRVLLIAVLMEAVWHLTLVFHIAIVLLVGQLPIVPKHFVKTPHVLVMALVTHSVILHAAHATLDGLE